MKRLGIVILLFLSAFLPVGMTAAAQTSDAAMALNIKYLGEPLPAKWLQKLDPILRYESEFYKSLGLSEDFNLVLHAFEDRNQGYREIGDKIGKKKWVSESGVKTAGVFVPKLDLVAIFGMEMETEDAVGLIAHEVSHAFFHQVYPYRIPIPTWLNEGLAEYFEHCSANKKGKVSHEIPDTDKGRIKTKYMLGEIDVKTFLDYKYAEFMQMEYTDDMSAYRLAHAIVSFLLEEAQDGYFQTCFNALKQRGKDESPSMVIDRTYNGGIEAFEKDFRTFIVK